MLSAYNLRFTFYLRQKKTLQIKHVRIDNKIINLNHFSDFILYPQNKVWDFQKLRIDYDRHVILHVTKYVR